MFRDFQQEGLVGDACAANNLLMTAITDNVELRTSLAVRAGSYQFDAENVVTGWHSHGVHQIEYAARGVVEVETSTGKYRLPPQQALWIPAGVAHRTTLRNVRTVSVFLDPEAVSFGGDRVRVLAAAPVLREMILYAVRWPIGRTDDDALAGAYFDALTRLAQDWLAHELPLYLPSSDDPIIARAMAFTDAHARDVRFAAVASEAGVSERTLRRMFLAATSMTWREYAQRSRLMRAMGLLAEAGPSVLDVSMQVGFDSVSAFTRAFVAYTGHTPTSYRRQSLGASASGADG